MTEPDEFNPSGWWKVVAWDGELLMETSDSGELKRVLEANPRSKLYRLFERTVSEWREQSEVTRQKLAGNTCVCSFYITGGPYCGEYKERIDNPECTAYHGYHHRL